VQTAIVQFQKISIPTISHKRDWNFLGNGGSVRPKNLKCMTLNWNFQRGRGVLEKIPSDSVGEVHVWILPGNSQGKKFCFIGV